MDAGAGPQTLYSQEPARSTSTCCSALLERSLHRPGNRTPFNYKTFVVGLDLSCRSKDCLQCLLLLQSCALSTTGFSSCGTQA